MSEEMFKFLSGYYNEVSHFTIRVTLDLFKQRFESVSSGWTSRSSHYTKSFRPFFVIKYS